MWANRTDDELIETIALETEPADLVVYVDHNKDNLDGANVQLFCHDPPEESQYALQDDGGYIFERSLPTLPPGECRLEVTKKG